MPVCSDPAITYLKSYGYSVLRLPRKDFAPLQILASQGRDFVPLGRLATVIVPKGHGSAPTLQSDIPAATINGRRSNELSLGVGLGILSGVIGAMGGGNLGLDGTYKNAAGIAFEFSDVFADEIEITLLDQYLATADLDPASKHVSTLLEADEIYVVTRTLKSATFTISATKKDGISLALDVPTIQGLVGGNVKVSASAGAADRIIYKGRAPLVFGFQAVQLFYENGKYTAFEPVAPGANAARAVAPPRLPKGVRSLSTISPFARVS